MDSAYKAARNIEERIRDSADDSGAITNAIALEANHLCEEFQMKKNPNQLLDRLKRLRAKIESTKGTRAFSHGDYDDLMDRCEELTIALRRLA